MKCLSECLLAPQYSCEFQRIRSKLPENFLCAQNGRCLVINEMRSVAHHVEVSLGQSYHYQVLILGPGREGEVPVTNANIGRALRFKRLMMSEEGRRSPWKYTVFDPVLDRACRMFLAKHQKQKTAA